jgi:hypothetical protein
MSALLTDSPESFQLQPWIESLYRKVRKLYPRFYGETELAVDEPLTFEMVDEPDFNVDLIVSSRPRRQHQTLYPPEIFALWKETEREALNRPTTNRAT